jgi:hypothetical protein
MGSESRKNEDVLCTYRPHCCDELYRAATGGRSAQHRMEAIRTSHDASLQQTLTKWKENGAAQKSLSFIKPRLSVR